MSELIECVRLNHFNVVLKDFDASVQHLKRHYSAEFLVDIPQPEWHAGLITFGDVIFEIFCPHEFLLNARYGPHFIGLEFQADMTAVRKVLASNGIGIVRDIGEALHTNPADCFGIAFEFYGGSFHGRSWDLLGRKMLPPVYWRDTHPLGVSGLKRCSVAVRSLDGAGEFFERLFKLIRIYEAPRPLLAANARGYRLADTVIELVAPAGAGALQAHLQQRGEGIRSTVFAVKDLDRAKRHFINQGLTIVEGDAEDAFGIALHSNLGISFEFAQEYA